MPLSQAVASPDPSATAFWGSALMWRAVAVVGWTALVSVVGFVGKAILKKMDDDKDERKQVMAQVAEVAASHEERSERMAERVEKVADDHRGEMKNIYERIFEWNRTTTAALSEVNVAVGDVGRRVGRLEERLPNKRARGR